MPNRYQVAAHKDMFETIARYEGKYCLLCFVDGAGRRNTSKLQIDHAGRERHLLCGEHNRAMRRLSLKAHESLMVECSAKNMCERIKLGLVVSEVRDVVDYKDGSLEMRAGAIILNRWLEFMNEYIKANQSITKDNAIYAGAMASGGNPSTIYRHVRTYSAFNGPYQEIRQHGEKLIIFRPNIKAISGNGHHGPNGHKALEGAVSLVHSDGGKE